MCASRINHLISLYMTMIIPVGLPWINREQRSMLPTHVWLILSLVNTFVGYFKNRIEYWCLVWFKLCPNDFVNKIYQNVNYQLYCICKIQKYLEKPTTEKMINSAVTFHLDYCNSLLYGIHGYSVSQLQHCQDNAARIVSLWLKHDHITLVVKEQHWLPIEQRINYKNLLLANNPRHGMVPRYVSSLLSPYKHGRPLRSEGRHLRTTPGYRLEGFVKRFFTHAAPFLWNTLPISIKCDQTIHTFKNSVKTHLFNVAYS